MFQNLEPHRLIFVTGPHRSGTTICARMIAEDTGHAYVPEDDFGAGDAAQFSAHLAADFGPMVIQCPFFCHVIHDLNYLFDVDMSQSMVVMMKRGLVDIKKSEENTKSSTGNVVQFDGIGEKQKRRYNTAESLHISEIRYRSWLDQRKRIPNWMEVEYESLKGHDLWSDEHHGFALRQTEAGVVPDDSLLTRTRRVRAR